MFTGSSNAAYVTQSPFLESEMFENNELLDSLWFRIGVHTVVFWSWVAAACVLLAIRY
jgi:hypothetical protein